MSCLHSNTVEDVSIGEIICTDCALVIDRVYYHNEVTASTSSYCNDILNANVRNFLLDLADRFHLSSISNCENRIRQMQKHFRENGVRATEKCIAAFALYKELSASSVTLEDVAYRADIPVKNLWKLERTLQQHNQQRPLEVKDVDVPEKYMTTLCYHLNIPKVTAMSAIKKWQEIIKEQEQIWASCRPRNVAISFLCLFLNMKPRNVAKKCVCSLNSIRRITKMLIPLFKNTGSNSEEGKT